MKRISVILLCLFTISAVAQKLNLSDPAYLKNSVPTDNNGIVTFKKEINTKNNKSVVFNNATQYIKQLINDSEIQDNSSRITSIDENNGEIIARISENLYFERRKWCTDVTRFNYQIIAKCQDNKLDITIWQISYQYGEGISAFNYKAEEWITDKYALNKKQNKLLKNVGKFRIFTIKRVKDILSGFESALQ